MLSNILSLLSFRSGGLRVASEHRWKIAYTYCMSSKLWPILYSSLPRPQCVLHVSKFNSIEHIYVNSVLSQIRSVWCNDKCACTIKHTYIAPYLFAIPIPVGAFAIKLLLIKRPHCSSCTENKSRSSLWCESWNINQSTILMHYK